MSTSQSGSLSTQQPAAESFYPKSVEVKPGTAFPVNETLPVQQQQVPANNSDFPQQVYNNVQPAVNSSVVQDSEPVAESNIVEKLTGRTADYMQLGFESYERGEYERARMLFEQVIAMQPDYIQAYYHLADILYLQGKFEQAKANFDIFLGYYPSHRKALLGLMYCDLKLGNLDEARDILNNKINNSSSKQENKGSWDGLFQN